jgi:uncharacterized protein (DUF2252 family)
LDLRPVPDEIAESVTKQARECVIGFTKEKQITEAPSEIASWSGHEAHFIRTLLHVANRAENILCEPLVSRFLFSHHNYDLSAFSVYKRALQKEIEAFDYSMTFADLRACQPPQAFVHLWKNDLHEWWSQTQTDTRTAQLVAAVAPYVNVQSSQGTEE